VLLLGGEVIVSLKAFLRLASPFTTTNGADTIAAVLDRHRGHAPGFDGLRLWLAISIVVFHGTLVSYGLNYQADIVQGPFRPVFLLVLPVFFGLSGFLITGSMLRVRSLRVFVAHRILRIVPALFCETVLSAFVIGPIFTTHALSDYFSSPLFFSYFNNIIGRIRYYLPGVFEGNPLPGTINAQLWTIPVELDCYLIFTILMFFGISFSRRGMLLVLIGAMSIFAGAELGGLVTQSARDVASSYVLVVSFVAGVAVYLWRDRIRVSSIWALIAFACFAIIFYYNTFTFLAPVFAIYLTVYIGMKKVPKIAFLAKGDYSYGIYLYGFPIQQMIAYCFPDLRYAWFNVLISVPLTILMAVLSWDLIEKRVLQLKKHIRASKINDIQIPVVSAIRELRRMLRLDPAIKKAGQEALSDQKL
jgi:peptidoglycan/LPS O-acetylase OafA/YrhL